MKTLAEIFPTRFGGYWGTEPGNADVDALAVRNGDIGTSGALQSAGLPCRGFTDRQVAKARLHAGDLLLTTSGYCGNVAFVDAEPAETVVATNFVRVLRTLPALIHDRYAFHYLRSPDFHDAIAPYIRGATIQNLAVEEAFAAVSVHLPALQEQRRIAAILDHADTLRAKRRQVLEHIDSLLQATFRDVFAKSASETVALGDLAVLVTKGTTPSSIGLGLAATGIPFLRAQNIQARSVVFGPNDWHLAPPVHQALGRSTIRGGDLLLSIAGTIGRAGIVPSDAPEMNCNQAVAIVRIPDQRLARWTLGWLESSDARQQIQASSVTGTITNLSLAQVRALKVPVPPQASLKTYERRYEGSTKVHQLVLRAMAREVELFASLETRAFRGAL